MTQTELKQMIREELEKSSGSKKRRTTESSRRSRRTGSTRFKENRRKRLNEETLSFFDVDELLEDTLETLSRRNLLEIIDEAEKVGNKKVQDAANEVLLFYNKEVQGAENNLNKTLEKYDDMAEELIELADEEGVEYY